MKKTILLVLPFVFRLSASGLQGTSPGLPAFKVSILQQSSVEGHTLRAGDYLVNIKSSGAVILRHRQQVMELPAHVERSGETFADTEVQYSITNSLEEIRLGGTQTKIVFESPSSAATLSAE